MYSCMNPHTDMHMHSLIFELLRQSRHLARAWEPHLAWGPDLDQTMAKN
jgi:hypothetical protein